MSLIDKTTIKLYAGNGGDGIISWRREAHHANGGPWGGDGGNGGDIIVVGDHNENDLQKLKYIKSIHAENGENGGTKLCHGSNGSDTIIRVPLGTVITNIDTGEKICDIIENGQQETICYGGKGGHGNAYFKSSYNKAPNLFEKGEIGEKVNAFFELKYVADVGIIGYPNAGKSTLINSISNTKAKVANYQFTTLNPILGVVKKGDESLTFADIPGLIEGASTGVGLGHDFLKHIERCKVLIHLVSASDEDNEDVVNAYETISNELKKYDSSILDKKIFISISKNEFDTDNKKRLTLSKYIGENIYTISSSNNNFGTLIDDVFNYYKDYKKSKEISINENAYKEIKLKKEIDDILEIKKIDENIWSIKSNKIRYWINRIPHTTDENIIRFNQKINIEDIQEKLIKEGAKKGDIFILDDELEYIID